MLAPTCDPVRTTARTGETNIELRTATIRTALGVCGSVGAYNDGHTDVGAVSETFGCQLYSCPRLVHRYRHTKVQLTLPARTASDSNQVLKGPFGKQAYQFVSCSSLSDRLIEAR